MKKFDYDGIAPVKTTGGLVQGYLYDETFIFKGIPYAHAERFQMPTAPEKWEGIRECASYGKVCPLLYPENPNGELLVPHMYWPQDEHCQNLNIWTPTLDGNTKKPVLVWFHGGGFFAGSSIEQLAYDGQNLSQYGDVVVVTINHRLNILGFMDLSDFGEKYKNSANAGFADIVEALRWIQENIENFGGDKNNVTIFGQSGGGMKVSAMMQIPEAAGLFHKGIIMSGVAGDFMPPYPPCNGKQIVEALLAELHLESVEMLEKVPYTMLAFAYMKVAPALMQQGVYVGNNPMLSDYYLGEPQVTEFSEKAKKTPLLIGSVFGEMSFVPSTYDKYSMSEEEMMSMIRAKFNDNTEAVVELFKQAYPDKKIIDILQVDTLFRPLSKDYARAKAQYSEAPTYNYLFTLEFPYQHGKPAWHCSDIPFVFHNIDKVPVTSIPGVSEKLEKQISDAIIAFARTGNPNHEGLPKWEPCTKDHEVTMIFDKVCESKENFDDDLIEKFKEVLPKFSLEQLMASMGDVQH